MARRIETFFVSGPAGKLECILEEPEDLPAVEAALVCHPHPQHGGTMLNKVVHRLARGLRKTGCVVLRFNYRGVNLSEGEYGHTVGETEDARAVLAELGGRYPGLPLLAGGFSFGSRIALRVAAQVPEIRRAIAVGFPTAYRDREFVYEVKVPKYFIHSTNDEFGPRAEMTEFYESIPEPKHMEWIEAADHFFRDNLDGYEEVVERVGRAR